MSDFFKEICKINSANKTSSYLKICDSIFLKRAELTGIHNVHVIERSYNTNFTPYVLRTHSNGTRIIANSYRDIKVERIISSYVVIMGVVKFYISTDILEICYSYLKLGESFIISFEDVVCGYKVVMEIVGYDYE